MWPRPRRPLPKAITSGGAHDSLRNSWYPVPMNARYVRVAGRILGMAGWIVVAWARPLEAVEPDLTTPEVQALRQEWLAAKAKVEEDRGTAMKALFDGQLQSAKEQLARARVAGNTTQQAVARAAQQVFEAAAARFQKDGTVTFPEKVRREVQPVLDSAKRSVSGIDGVRDASLKTLDREHAVRLFALLRDQGVEMDGESAAEAFLPQLARTEAKAPASVAGGATPGEGSADGAPAAEAPQVLGSNGAAEAWIPLMNIGAQVSVLEVVSVSVADVASERSTKTVGMGTQQEIALRVVPLQVLATPKVPVVFRAMSIPGKLPVDIMTWPSDRNGWTVEFRCRPKGGGTHAFRLEVADGTAGLLPANP